MSLALMKWWMSLVLLMMFQTVPLLFLNAKTFAKGKKIMNTQYKTLAMRNRQNTYKTNGEKMAKKLFQMTLKGRKTLGECTKPTKNGYDLLPQLYIINSLTNEW